jgi:flagellar biosynthesis protein FlhF
VIKIYEANDMRQALAQVYKELGPHAQIIHQRELPAAGVWPFRRRRWEIIATDETPGSPSLAAGETHDSKLEAEIADIRDSLTRLVRSANLHRLPDSTAELTDIYESLCHHGMASDLAQDLVLGAREELSATAQNNAELVQAAVRRQMEQRLNIRSPKLIGGKGPLVIFLFGQAGVGKTTTLIKLASRQALYENRRVGIINADSLRPGSHSQIEALSKAFDITLQSISDTHPQIVQSTLADYADKDVVFVDTPGHSRLDREALRELAAMVKVAPRRQAFLVIEATTALQEMHEIVNSFRLIGLDGLVFTKVDETDHLGAMVTLASQGHIPVAYLSAGRQITEDIETATREHISAWIFGIDSPARPARPTRKRTSADHDDPRAGLT